jgi:hypothetical protein
MQAHAHGTSLGTCVPCTRAKAGAPRIRRRLNDGEEESCQCLNAPDYLILLCHAALLSSITMPCGHISHPLVLYTTRNGYRCWTQGVYGCSPPFSQQATLVCADAYHTACTLYRYAFAQMIDFIRFCLHTRAARLLRNLAELTIC